jgi:hypothetical protein
METRRLEIALPFLRIETLNLSIDDPPYSIFIAAPARATSQVLLGEVDITLRSDSEGDVTTEESFPKKCIVDGNAYSHSQTVTTDKINQRLTTGRNSFAGASLQREMVKRRHWRRFISKSLEKLIKHRSCEQSDKEYPEQCFLNISAENRGKTIVTFWRERFIQSGIEMSICG